MAARNPLAQRDPGIWRRDDGSWDVQPFTLGPTWERDPAWLARNVGDRARCGDPSAEGYILPELTLGWEILRWIEDNLLSDETDEAGNALPFIPTKEQARFILWWYAIDETGRFLFREAVLQRLKGWGKDPLVAVLAFVELVGPCRFAGWATRDIEDKDLKRGDPVGKPHPRAWIQIAAVSKTQTRNTTLLFEGLVSERCKSEHRIDPGKEFTYAYFGKRQIQSLTSAPAALEGGRPTLVIKNETHHWRAANRGHEMADVIERNATKAKDGAARSISITNAYEPSQASVAQMEREAYEDQQAGLFMKTGILYDTIEAPPGARLRPPKGSKSDPDPTEEEVRAYIGAILRSVRGDSVWLDIPNLTTSILDGKKNPASRSRRFWYNQVVASEDVWAHPDAVDAAVSALARSAREDPSTTDVLRAGWLVQPGEPIATFLDCSKSDDSTAYMGCRLSDGYLFTLGVWQKPKGDRGEGWLVPREAVDARVHEVHRLFDVKAFWADPSHALDDEDSSRYWDSLMGDWHVEFGDKLQAWPVKSGNRTHSIMFDMTSSVNTALFVGFAEAFIEDLETLNDIEEYAPKVKIDGHPALLKHLKAARKNPGIHGVSLMKASRSSEDKIDLGVAAVGAYMVRRVLLNKGMDEEENSTPGRFWGA